MPRSARSSARTTFLGGYVLFLYLAAETFLCLSSSKGQVTLHCKPPRLMIPQTNYEINRQERVANMHFLRGSLWNLSFPSSMHLSFTDSLLFFLLKILLLEKIIKLFILLGGQQSVFLFKQLWCEHPLAWCHTPAHTLLPCNPTKITTWWWMFLAYFIYNSAYIINTYMRFHLYLPVF